MKYLYIFLLVAAVACSKSESSPEDVNPDVNLQDAVEFQISYMEPVSNVIQNYISSISINGNLLESQYDYSNYILQTYSTLPSWAYNSNLTPKYTSKAGDINLKFIRSGQTVYDKTFNLKAGFYSIIVYDLEKLPLIIPQKSPFEASTWNFTDFKKGVDSVFAGMFVNLLYDGGGVPFSGKAKLQYRPYGAEKWSDASSIISFGQYSPFYVMHFDDNGYLVTPSDDDGVYSMYQRIDYRLVDEDGKVLKRVMNRRPSDFTDYYQCRIGRAYLFFASGNLDGNNGNAQFCLWQLYKPNTSGF